MVVVASFETFRTSLLGKFLPFVVNLTADARLVTSALWETPPCVELGEWIGTFCRTSSLDFGRYEVDFGVVGRVRVRVLGAPT